jgi:hypothetical protein
VLDPIELLDFVARLGTRQGRRELFRAILFFTGLALTIASLFYLLRPMPPACNGAPSSQLERDAAPKKPPALPCA